MSINYVIDQEQGVVFTTLSDTLTFDECLEHHRKLGADPAFDPSYRELLDGTTLKRVALISSSVLKLSKTCPFGTTARRAMCSGDKKLHYGIARMFQAFASDTHGEIEVFKDRNEALRWLGVDPDTYHPQE